MSETLKHIVLILVPLAGLGLAIARAIYRSYLKLKVADFVRTVGTVVSNKERSDFEGPSYHPIVEYKVDGRKYSVEGSVGHGKPKQEGAPIAVIYDPHKPATSYVAEDYFFLSSALIGVGIVMLLMGLLTCYHLW
ncbi:MAG: DUF3592 domain-containing protein [Verrucomicrobiota bacterium]